jgi:DNA polymerase (family X)
MSDGTRMSLPFAKHLAEQMIDLLKPYCERIAVAGSIRREKPDVGDVEICLIPAMQPDLLGEWHYSPDLISEALTNDGFVLPKNGDHFKQAKLPNGGVTFDIFLTTPECWGVIFTIRTGCAEFSHKLVTPRNQGGLLPSYLRVKDGRVWHGNTVMDTPSEEDFFRVIGLPWIPPENREVSHV